MKTNTFKSQQIEKQLQWRKEQDISLEFGKQNGRHYEHIINKKEWEKTLWKGIRSYLLSYLKANNIQHHTGTHNLLSSWVLCSNLYFICKINSYFNELIRKFLALKLNIEIDSVENVELEYALEGILCPNDLLGETDGNRGSGQTSPDVAFIIKNNGKNGLILVECKYTEHSFYACSGRKKKHQSGKIPNPDPIRCLDKMILKTMNDSCHHYMWGRKYWDYLTFTEYAFRNLKVCPASKAGYQLLRQQALAEGIAQSGHYSPVFSVVAFDKRNKKLMSSMNSSGIRNISEEWGLLFKGLSNFSSWEHQEWVNFVREKGDKAMVQDWIEYIEKRYEM
jgi:hypothetical protein